MTQVRKFYESDGDNDNGGNWQKVSMDDRFESVHVWSEEVALKNNGRWTPTPVLVEGKEVKGESPLLDLAEKFQEECHSLTKNVIHLNPKISVQDATNVWIFNKLAELQLLITHLTNKQ